MKKNKQKILETMLRYTQTHRHIYTHTYKYTYTVEKGQLFPTVECRLINVEGMIEIGNSPFNRLRQKSSSHGKIR